MKLAKVLVGFEGYDWQNVLTVRSVVSGRTVTLRCNGKWDLMSEGLRAFVDRYQHGKGADYKEWSMFPKHEDELSYELMREILQLAQ